MLSPVQLCVQPLFANKPLIVACNKTDLQPWETLPEDDKQTIQRMGREAAKCGGGLVTAPAVAAPSSTAGAPAAGTEAGGAVAAASGDVSMGEGATEDGPILFMSTLSDVGVVGVKNAACERLLQVRALTLDKQEYRVLCTNNSTVYTLLAKCTAREHSRGVQSRTGLL